MPGAVPEGAEPNGSTVVLSSFGGLQRSRATMVSPKSVEELRQTLVNAARAGRRVTLRGGGHSFDSQALSDDVAISAAKLAAIGAIDVAKGLITTDGGATWGALLNALAAH